MIHLTSPTQRNQSRQKAKGENQKIKGENQKIKGENQKIKESLYKIEFGRPTESLLITTGLCVGKKTFFL